MMMKTNNSEENIPIRAEMSDWNREREILVQESIEGKNSFAQDIKDTLGEQIKAELAKKEKFVEDNPKKESKIKLFLDKLSSICQ